MVTRTSRRESSMPARTPSCDCAWILSGVIPSAHTSDWLTGCESGPLKAPTITASAWQHSWPSFGNEWPSTPWWATPMTMR